MYRGRILRVTRQALGSDTLNLDQSRMSIQILPEPTVEGKSSLGQGSRNQTHTHSCFYEEVHKNKQANKRVKKYS